MPGKPAKIRSSESPPGEMSTRRSPPRRQVYTQRCRSRAAEFPGLWRRASEGACPELGSPRLSRSFLSSAPSSPSALSTRKTRDSACGCAEKFRTVGTRFLKCVWGVRGENPLSAFFPSSVCQRLASHGPPFLVCPRAWQEFLGFKMNLWPLPPWHCRWPIHVCTEF